MTKDEWSSEYAHTLKSKNDENNIFNNENIKKSLLNIQNTKKASKIIYESLYDKIEESALDNADYLVKCVKDYINRNSESLMIHGPYKMLYFTKSDKAIVFNTCNISENFVKNVVEKSPEIDKKWILANDPFNIITPILTAVYTINEKKLNTKDKPLDMTLLLFAFRHYSSKMMVQFPYGANERIMEYTINNISNKYLIKNYSTMYELLYYMAKSNHELIINELINTHYDAYVKYYISNLSTKISSLLKNIKDEYLKNRDEGKYLNLDEDTYSDDSKELRNLQTVSSIISGTTDKIYLKMKSNPPNDKIIKYATSRTNISYSSTVNTLKLILENEKELLREIINLILQLYFIVPENHHIPIRSQHFYEYSLEIYTTSRTTDSSILRIKEILDIWLTEYSKDYKKFNSETSKINFRKTIYIYIVLYISSNA